MRSGVTLHCALPGPYVPLRVTHGALVTYRYTYAPPHCRISQYHRTFILLSVSLWIAVAGLAGFRTRANVFFIGLSCFILTIVFFYFSISLLSVYRLVLWCWCYISALHSRPLSIIIIIIMIITLAWSWLQHA